MTDNEFALLFLSLICAFVGFAMLLRTIENVKTSHRGATEPSKLPPPPPKKHHGPWFLCVEFSKKGKPDYYMKAEDILTIVGDEKTETLTVKIPNRELTFHVVYRYYFVQLSQMGEYLFCCWDDEEEDEDDEDKSPTNTTNTQ